MIAHLVRSATVAVLLLTPVTAAAVCGNSIVELGEQCDGGVCCTASCTFEPGTTTCRAGVGVCDNAERCTGATADCPPDFPAEQGRLCRGALGPCDVSEFCDGTTFACPSDALLPATTECRRVAPICPTPTGPTPTGPTPTKTPTPSATAATPTATGPTPDPFANCEDSPCDVAELCNGVDPTCPPNTFEPDTTECRASAGVCDPAELCSGIGVTCPLDAKSSATCRPSTGPCDPVESCNGSDDDCASDTILPAGTICRATTGGCDIVETCGGVSGSCPADAFESGGTECRASAGICDPAETCAGGVPGCPGNAFEPASVECRATAGFCDVAESCTGSTAACPADGFKPDGTACNDSLACTIDDACSTGTCVGDPMTCGDGIVQTNCGEQCDDGGTTAGDGCNPVCQSEAGLGCPVTPLPGCRLAVVPGKGSIKIRDLEKIGGLTLDWRWGRGAATDVSEFGDPVMTTSYQLCIYDQNGLLTGSTAPAGGTCGVTNPRPCWKRVGAKGFKYADSSQSIEPGGIRKISLRAGGNAKADVRLRATGGIFEFPSNGGLGLPDLAAIQQPFLIQVQNSNGLCFESVFSAPPKRQDPNRFEDQAD